MRVKVSSAKCRPLCLGFNVLIYCTFNTEYWFMCLSCAFYTKSYKQIFHYIQNDYIFQILLKSVKRIKETQVYIARHKIFDNYYHIDDIWYLLNAFGRQYIVEFILKNTTINIKVTGKSSQIHQANHIDHEFSWWYVSHRTADDAWVEWLEGRIDLKLKLNDRLKI